MKIAVIGTGGVGGYFGGKPNDKLPYDSTSSLTRDVWEGKPSEIEYQNGTVVKLGLEYSVETPVNRFVYHCILPMELKARKITN
jgi:2-dehydropantoate 2-reductase